MKNVWKIVSVIMLISIFLMSNICFASAAGDIKTKGTKILSAILWFGYAIALGMVVFIGIKYILGAADAKANMKSAITNWLIGAFIVFMCTTIVGWVVGIIGENSASQIIGAANGLTSDTSITTDSSSSNTDDTSSNSSASSTSNSQNRETNDSSSSSSASSTLNTQNRGTGGYTQ